MKSVKLVVVVLSALVLSGCCSILSFMPWCDGVGPSIEGHKASFLFDNGGTRVMNILSPRLSFDQFKGIVQRCKGNGDNMLYLYLMNEKDGPWTPYSMYVNNQIGGTIDDGVVSEYKRRIEYVRDEKLGIVFWLRADDSPNFNKTLVRSADGQVKEVWVYTAPPKDIAPVDESFLTNGPALSFNRRSTASQEKYQADAVNLFDKYASAWIVGLEANEYYSDTTVNHFANQLQQLTSKPIGVHMTPMKYSAAQQPAVDGLWLQYGFNKSPSQVKSDTQNIAGKLGGKPVYATEYNLSSDSATAKAQGDAAISGGAHGTGNGRN